MKKVMIIVLLLIATMFTVGARTITRVREVHGHILHSLQAGWVIIDETTSAGDEATTLDGLHDGSAEMTKAKVEAAIAAASSGDDEISTFVIPSGWNGIRFRSVGITEEDTQTYQVYLGSTGGGEDCELSYAGQLVWTSGSQSSVYFQITFTSGGTYVPQPGDTVTGNTSAETAVVMATPTAATGSFAAANATGTIKYRSKSGTFTGLETVKIGDGKNNKANVLTHADSDLVGFELADSVVVTAKSWGSAWSTTSPGDDTNAEAALDVNGADYLVVLASETSHDCKLLAKGY